MTFKTLLTIGAASLAGLSANAFAAPITIDPFTDLQEVDTDPTTDTDDSSTITNGDFFGNEGRTRTLTVENLTDQNGESGTSADIGTKTVASGALDFNNGSLERGKVTLAYDFGGAVDLFDSTNDSLLLDFLSSDFSQGVDLTVFDTDSSFTVSQSTPNLFSGDLVFDFAAFTGIDFSEVTALTLMMEPSADSADATVNFIATSSAAVPIPGAAPLLISAFAGFGAFRRFKRA